MVDVEQGPLRTLQQDVLAPRRGLIQGELGVGDAVHEPLGQFQHLVDDPGRVQRLTVVDLDQHLVLDVEGGFDLLGQDRLVQQILGADPHPGHLVLVGRADPTAGGADLGLAQVALGDLVDGHVVRHDQVRIRADQQVAGVHVAGLEAAQLGEQDGRVDDHPVADDVLHARRQDARGDQVQRELLTVRQHDGVPGVVAALVANYPLDAFTVEIGGFALALVAPLGADQYDDCHE